MIREGYAWDYISDLQLINTEVNEGMLQTEGNIYRTLVLPGCKYIPLETFSRIMKLVNDGASVIIYDHIPENIAGWADLEEKNYAFNQLKNRLDFGETDHDGIRKAILGKGSVVIGNDLGKLLVFSGIRRESMADFGLSFTRRETKTSVNYFILNQSEKVFDGWLPVNTYSPSPAIFNPVTDQHGLAKIRMNTDGTPQLFARLYPGESLIVSAYKNPVKGKPYLFYDPVTTPTEIKGNWKIEFISGGPSLPSAMEVNSLKSWTDNGNDDLKNFSGTASYKISFARPSSRTDAWMLNLGKVAESATVILNGKEIASLIGPDFSVLIPKKQIKKNNTIEIRVSNLMANRIAYMDRNNIEWKKFYNINMAARMRQNTKNGLFDASSWPPMESGLMGPVTITPVRAVR